MIRLIQRKLIIPRGDTGSFSIEPITEASSGDAAVFTIFDKLTHTKIFSKTVEIKGNLITFSFTHNDTVNLIPGRYLWDIKFYKNPVYADGELINGEEINSYYAAFSLPECEIKQTGDNLLISPTAPTATLSSNQLDIINSALNQIAIAVNQTIANVEHYPVIINGNWHTWNAQQQQYINTGISAAGDSTTKADKVINGTAGNFVALNSEGNIVDSGYNSSNLLVEEIDPTVPAWAKASQKPTYTAQQVGAISNNDRGVANGVAELDANGKVPSSQLPSYVDDVIEYNTSINFPAEGESGKIYVDTSMNRTYRWSGSGYTEISASLALGETSSTAYRGDLGAAAYAHAVTNKGVAKESGLYKIVTNSEGHVIAGTAVEKSDITSLGIPAQDTTYESKVAVSEGNDVSLVTTGEKYNWNSKYDKPVNGIPLTDLADGVIPVSDVQINGTTVLANNIANIPVATSSKLGVVKTNSGQGTQMLSSTVAIVPASAAAIKLGNHGYHPITPFQQHVSAFYGLAKAAGDTTQASSNNEVGIYTDMAKSKIQTMLGIDTMIAPNEQDYTANKKYISGDIFVTDGKLYEANTSILSGGTISPGINCDETNVADQLNKKINRLSLGVQGHFASIAGDGTITDSGYSYSSFLTEHQSISGKVDKVSGATNGNFASLDASGNLSDSGVSTSDFLTSHQDISGKADKVSGATNGNFAALDSNGNLIDSGYKHSDYLTAHQTIPVTDVQVEETSILSNGIANIPKASVNNFGVTKFTTTSGVGISAAGIVYLAEPTNAQIKSKATYVAVTPSKQDIAVFYGLAKAAGDSTQEASDNAVGTYTDNAKTAIRSMLGATTSNIIAVQDTQPSETDTKIWLTETPPTSVSVPTVSEMNNALNEKANKVLNATNGNFVALDANGNLVDSGHKHGDYITSVPVTDIQINNTSIISNNVATIPIATSSSPGVAKYNSEKGIAIDENDALYTVAASTTAVKSGTQSYKPIVPVHQHESVFYGLAKAAGDTTQSSSSNLVGTYTETAQSKIHEMLDAPITISGTTPTITAKPGMRYICGEVSSLSFTPSQTGICDVIFTSGTSVTVLTVPNTIKWPDWFDPTSLDINTTYELNVLDGVYGAVGKWI